MITTFKALSEESRLKILALLVDHDMCVCDIERGLNMTQSNVSRHLSALKTAGIVECKKKAQWAYYGISDQFKLENRHLWAFLQEKFDQSPYIQWKRTKDANQPVDDCLDCGSSNTKSIE